MDRDESPQAQRVSLRDLFEAKCLRRNGDELIRADLLAVVAVWARAQAEAQGEGRHGGAALAEMAEGEALRAMLPVYGADGLENTCEPGWVGFATIGATVEQFVAGLQTLDTPKLVARQMLQSLLGEAETPAAPLSAEPVPAVMPAQPPPLTTGDVAFCFAGLHYSEAQWKKPLGDKPRWLAACVAIPGRRGVSQTQWNPVLIGGALVSAGHTKAHSVRARFQTKPMLQPWLDAWKTYEAEYLDSA